MFNKVDVTMQMQAKRAREINERNAFGEQDKAHALRMLGAMIQDTAEDPRPRWLRLFHRVGKTSAMTRLIAGLNNHVKVIVGHMTEEAGGKTRFPNDLKMMRKLCNPRITRSGQLVRTQDQVLSSKASRRSAWG